MRLHIIIHENEDMEESSVKTFVEWRINMFMVRLRSSIILLAITLLVVIIGGKVLFTVTMLLSMIGMWELLRMVQVHDRLNKIGCLAVILQSLLIYFEKTEYLLPFFVGYLLLVMTDYVLSFPKYNAEQVLYTFFGLFYVGLMMSYIYRVRMLPQGDYLVWLIFIGSWGSDTSAYCAGILFGKHKAAPVLSPKKTWEGCIGGVIGAALLSVLYGIIMNKIFGPNALLSLYAVIGACAAVISQIGDLAASALKRNHNIKDYGKLIPGHGGVLDRFDSVIFVAPLVYYLAVYCR